jgi:predicted AlkP superfamily phosphohydrolase/phosphomutase/tetratricopeptide (TPR) repeat protein
MLERGELPALSRLIEQGVMGRLTSLHPIAPVVTWNTIATGKTPDRHGILGALEPDPESGRLSVVSGRSRRAKALWQMTSERGIATHVAGWFGAVPAESIEGVFIASNYGVPRGHSAQAWQVPEDSVYPAGLRDTLAELRMHPSEVPSQSLLALVPKAREVDQRYDDRLTRISFGLSTCCSIHNAATWALEHQPWDFAAIYYNATGYFSEAFMPYHAPRMQGIGEREFEIYGEVVSGIYRFHDLMLARLMELAGPDAAIVLVSGSGYHSGERRPKRGETGFQSPSAWLTDQGILCMRGPGIRRDELIRGASILDIAPTVLTLLGLPVGEDMDGRVLIEAFERISKTEHIPSWEEKAGESADSRMNSIGARGLADQFLALGQMDAGAPKRHPSEESAAEDLRFNLVCVYMSTGRPQSALPILEQLFDAAPEDVRYQRALAQCLLATGRFEDAERMLASLLAGHESHPWLHFLMGVIHMHRKKADQALAEFQKAEESGDKSAAIHAFIGNVYLAKRMWRNAEESFEKALGIDSEEANAHSGMAAVRLRQKREEEAADHALQAVAIRYELPIAHYQLGVAMARMGRYDRAVIALEAALKLAPDMSRVRRYLSQVRAMKRFV